MSYPPIIEDIFFSIGLLVVIIAAISIAFLVVVIVLGRRIQDLKYDLQDTHKLLHTQMDALTSTVKVNEAAMGTLIQAAQQDLLSRLEANINKRMKATK